MILGGRAAICRLGLGVHVKFPAKDPVLGELKNKVILQMVPPAGWDMLLRIMLTPCSLKETGRKQLISIS